MSHSLFFSTRTKSWWLKACGLIALAIATSACAPLIVGGTAATTALVATDRRTTGEQVEDQAIEMKTASEMRRLFENTDARVNVNTYAGHTLLTGDVPSETAKTQAAEAALKVEKVEQVYNMLRVGDKTSLSMRSNDTWLTSKVKTALINTKGVPTRTMIVTTERGIVYLLGRVTQAESERAAKVAASVNGVNKVIKAFEIVSAESISSEASSTEAVEPPSTDKTPATDPDDVQAMPVN